MSIGPMFQIRIRVMFDDGSTLIVYIPRLTPPPGVVLPPAPPPQLPHPNLLPPIRDNNDN